MNHRHNTNIAICKICGELNDAVENVILCRAFVFCADKQQKKQVDNMRQYGQ